MYKILICDDEKWIRKGILAKIQYHKLNFDSIMEAADGIEALEIIKKYMPDIVITDVRMPNLNGINLIEKSKELYPYIKFIVVSGYAEFEYVQKAINMGGKGYILKPISDENLVCTLNKVIDELNFERQAERIKSEEEELRQISREYKLETALNEILCSSVCAVSDVNINKVFKNSVQESKYILGIINIQYDGISNVEDFKIAKQNVKNILKKIGDKDNSLVVNNLEDVYQIIIILWGSDAERLKRSCEEYIINASAMTEELHNIQLTGAISNPDNMVSALLYKQARRAFDFRLVKGSSVKLYRYWDICSNNDGRFDYPDHKLKALSKCIDDGDLKNARIILKDIFSEKYFIHIYSLAYECVNMVVKTCNKKKIDTSILIPYELLTGNKIRNCSSINEIIEELYDIIRKAVDGNSENTYSTKNLVNIAQKYIEGHYSEELTVNALAHRFSINPNYFSNLFSKETGYTITKYITKVRIEKACQLLGETSITISDISANVGYQDPQYFYRVFKKEMNMTPADYRSNRVIKVNI